MTREDLLLLKYNPIRIDEEPLITAIMHYRNLTHDHIISTSMAGHLRLSRELLFYMLYVYTDLTIMQMVVKFRLNNVAIAGYIKAAAARVKHKEPRFLSLEKFILSLLATEEHF